MKKLIYGKKLISPSIQSLKGNAKKTMNPMDIAGGMVFNNTKRDFYKMIEAYENVLEIMDIINDKVEKVFNLKCFIKRRDLVKFVE